MPDFNEPVNIKTLTNKDKVKLRVYSIDNNTKFGLVELFGSRDFRTMLLQGDGVLVIGSDFPSQRDTEAVAGHIQIKDKAGKIVFNLNGQYAALQIGADGNEGGITVKDDEGRSAFVMNGKAADLQVGADGNGGGITVKDDEGRSVFVMNGKVAELQVGADGNEGGINVRGANAKDIIILDGKTGDVVLRDSGNVHAFGLHTQSGDDHIAGLWIGSSEVVDGVGNKTGNITLRDNKGNDSIQIMGGTENRGGGMQLSDEFGKITISITAHRGGDDTATIRIGGGERNGQIILRDENDKNTLTLDAKNGDIMLENADCAEEFDVYGYKEIEPGTVMVISNDGKLEISCRSYDKRVAGVVSGGGNLRPGIVLDKKKSMKVRAALAMLGKVYCKVDAQSSPINVGDLLTTSTIPGHAMKATKSEKAFGSIIGKALSTLKSGRGLIPILVALQ